MLGLNDHPGCRYATTLTSAFLTLAVCWGSVGTAAAELPESDRVQLWLRADRGVEQADGRVAAWRDQSGQGNDAVAEPGSGPGWSASALNGAPALVFDGKGSSLRVAHCSGLNADHALTVFCVYRYVDGFRIVQKKDASPGTGADAWFLSPGAGLGVSGSFMKSRYFAHGHTYVTSCVYDPESGTISVFANGDEAGTLTDVPACKP
ncbi:MAG: hypothetical protein JXR94_06385, partial [Candidatus Hydrogenedentes bacterium]|nr:hypothetical protein [Candidatus Hydrogenedentota bacterium]